MRELKRLSYYIIVARPCPRELGLCLESGFSLGPLKVVCVSL